MAKHYLHLTRNIGTVSYTHLQGVKDYLGAEVIAKGSKFSASDFDSLDFTRCV